MLNQAIIPENLLKWTNEPESSHILIGKNGAGKSLLLNRLANTFLDEGRKVIAISNTIYDKFPSKSQSNYFMMRDRAGRKKATMAIKKVLNSFDQADEDQLYIAAKSLIYVGFEPKIGIRIRFETNIDHHNHLIGELFSDRDELHFLEDVLGKALINRDTIFWIDLKDHSFESLNSTKLIWLVQTETELKNRGLIKGLEFFFSRNGVELPLLEASSGELGLVSTMFFLGMVIQPDIVILIDEPENSLHPEWQKQYISTILDNFYLFTPKIIIATHSPLVLNGERLKIELTHIYKSIDGRFLEYSNQTKNIEAAYADYFDVITPSNRMLSKRLIKLLNQLQLKQLPMEDFKREIENFKENIFDDQDSKQTTLLSGVLEIAEQL
ncbi:hypothetical protein D3C87_200790 [compost metagenome]